MAFYVGQKVECINAPNFEVFPDWDRYPSQGEQLTISGIKPYIGAAFNSPYALCFIEIGGSHTWFAGVRFRAVVKRATDISIFTALLTSTKVDA